MYGDNVYEKPLTRRQRALADQQGIRMPNPMLVLKQMEPKTFALPKSNNQGSMKTCLEYPSMKSTQGSDIFSLGSHSLNKSFDMANFNDEIRRLPQENSAESVVNFEQSEEYLQAKLRYIEKQKAQQVAQAEAEIFEIRKKLGNSTGRRVIPPQHPNFMHGHAGEGVFATRSTNY